MPNLVGLASLQWQYITYISIYLFELKNIALIVLYILIHTLVYIVYILYMCVCVISLNSHHNWIQLKIKTPDNMTNNSHYRDSCWFFFSFEATIHILDNWYFVALSTLCSIYFILFFPRIFFARCETNQNYLTINKLRSLKFPSFFFKSIFPFQLLCPSLSFTVTLVLLRSDVYLLDNQINWSQESEHENVQMKYSMCRTNVQTKDQIQYYILYAKKERKSMHVCERVRWRERTNYNNNNCNSKHFNGNQLKWSFPIGFGLF